MNRQRVSLTLTLALLLLLAVTALAASGPADTAAVTAAAPAAKQLAAAPAEFADGSLRLPDPAQLGVRSRAALLPVTLEPAADGQWGWSGQLAADGTAVSLLLLAPDGANWQLALRAPDGRAVDMANTPGEAAAYGLEGMQVPGTLYQLSSLRPGAWTLDVTAPAAGAGYVMLASDSPVQIYTHLTTHALLVGREIGLVTYAFDETDAAESGAPAALAAAQEATLRLQLPNGAQRETRMFDDGRHADGAAGDGVFGATFVPELAGSYRAQVLVRGAGSNGAEFLRSSEHVFPVLADALRLDAAQPVSALPLDANRLQLKLEGTLLAGLPGRVTAAAEVWGTDAAGQPVPVAWIGGLSETAVAEGRVTLPLTLDGRWIALAGAQAPFELRNVRVQDMATHVPLAQLERVPLQVRALPQGALAPIEAATDDMRMGPRPAAAPAPEANG
ncbi:MAG: hypothetical protein KC425_01150, partial [Anaerolineales bacterium]|nr:hypothetical protein [Anaerolineales bacterium]